MSLDGMGRLASAQICWTQNSTLHYSAEHIHKHIHTHTHTNKQTYTHTYKHTRIHDVAWWLGHSWSAEFCKPKILTLTPLKPSSSLHTLEKSTIPLQSSIPLKSFIPLQSSTPKKCNALHRRYAMFYNKQEQCFTPKKCSTLHHFNDQYHSSTLLQSSTLVQARGLTWNFNTPRGCILYLQISGNLSGNLWR